MFFFFKQKTAYELRISDWSSDVCSSDLASRGGGASGVSASNLHLAAGKATPTALMADIATGIYITELIGQGVNPVTGDYSRGASGFVIRDGQIAEPVAELTVAGNLTDMFRALVPADDLEFRQGLKAPPLPTHCTTVAGIEENNPTTP